MNKKDYFNAEAIDSLIARIESLPEEGHEYIHDRDKLPNGAFCMQAWNFSCGYPACMAGHASSMLVEQSPTDNLNDERNHEHDLCVFIAAKNVSPIGFTHVANTARALSGLANGDTTMLEDITKEMAIDALKQVRDTGEFGSYDTLE